MFCRGTFGQDACHNAPSFFHSKLANTHKSELRYFPVTFSNSGLRAQKRGTTAPFSGESEPPPAISPAKSGLVTTPGWQALTVTPDSKEKLEIDLFDTNKINTEKATGGGGSYMQMRSAVE